MLWSLWGSKPYYFPGGSPPLGYKIMAIIDFKKQNSKRSDRGSEELEQPKPTSEASNKQITEEITL